MVPTNRCVALVFIGLISSLGVPAASAKESPFELKIGSVGSDLVIDGNDDDWPADSAGILLGEASQLLGRPNRWKGAEDLSGFFRLAWSEEALYLFAEVLDQNPVQAADSPAGPWQGDSLELFFNGEPGVQRPANFRQIALVPSIGSEAEMLVVCPQGSFEGVVTQTIVQERGYRFEAKIPWSNLAPFHPESAARLGFQLMINDNDGRGRQTQLCWFPSAVTYSRPTQMGTLLLVESVEATAPRTLASPLTEMVTTADRFRFSILSREPEVSDVRVLLRGPGAELVEVGEIELVSSEGGMASGLGMVSTAGIEGPGEVRLDYRSEDGEILFSETRDLYFAGQRYSDLRDSIPSMRARLDSISEGSAPFDAKSEWLAGLRFWLGRLDSLLANQARPERLTPELLSDLVAEKEGLLDAIGQLEAGENPYAGRTGSFVRAYRSPLTGEWRPHALIVPETRSGEAALPMIVYLHGIYGDERNLFLDQEVFREIPAIVYQAASYRQFDWSDISAAETWSGMAQVFDEYAVDRQRIYLVGYHIGGRGALQLAMDRPGFFAGVVSGYPGVDVKLPYRALSLYPDFYEQATDSAIPFPHYRKPDRPQPITDPVEGKIASMLSLAVRAPNLEGVPLWLIRGEASPDAAAEQLALLQEVNPDMLRLSHDSGAMHGDQPPLLQDSEFYNVLLEFEKTEVQDDFEFVVTRLRNNRNRFVRVDGMTSPLEPAIVRVSREGVRIQYQTEHVSAFTPVVDSTAFAGAGTLELVVDGQRFEVPADQLPSFSLIRVDKHWERGTLGQEVKRHGLSGPINDSQMDRFAFVYGTGDEVDWEKAVGRLADYGLGTKFEAKADEALTASDIADKNLILVGSPESNEVLARIAESLPLKWESEQLVLGDWSAPRSEAAVCLVYPNPLAPDRYVVVLATDRPEGLRLWQERAGVDFVAGQLDSKGRFPGTLYRGFFNADWDWEAALTTRRAPL